MSIKINVDVQRSFNEKVDEGLTLVIFKNARFKSEITDRVVRIDSSYDLKNIFEYPIIGGAGTRDLASFRELYSAEYLLNKGVSILCYATDVAGEFDIDDVEHVKDQKEWKYNFIVAPYEFVGSVDVAAVGEEGEEEYVPGYTQVNYNEDLLGMLSNLSNEVDAELYLDLSPDTKQEDAEVIVDEIKSKASSRVELFLNSGFTNEASYFEVPVGIVLGETNVSDDFDLSTDFVGISASLAAVSEKAKMLRLETPWIPIAGEDTGVIKEFKSLYRRVFTAEKEEFQRNNINVLLNRTGVGSLFVSQNTMGETIDPKNPLLRSHVVTEALWIKRVLHRLSERVKYLPNNRSTWDFMSLKVKDIFRKLVSQEGVEEFSVRVGLGSTMTAEDIADGKLLVKVSYLPIRVIEEITFNVVIQQKEDTTNISIFGGDL